MKQLLLFLTLLLGTLPTMADDHAGMLSNPVIFADCPDMDIIRVDNNYYMVSTTMHFSPGCTIMKSKDLAHWAVIGYAHDQLETNDRFTLRNGQNEYANGSWAANIRYDRHEGRFYLIVTCNSTQRSYIFTTTDIEHGRWVRSVVPMCYDPGLLFEDTGTETKKYVVCPNASLKEHQGYLQEIIPTGDGHVRLSERQQIIDYTQMEDPSQGLRAEGYHGYKIGDYYYIFMIQGQGWQRQQTVWRSKSLAAGSFEGRKIFTGDIVDNETGKPFMPSGGVAQGGIVDTPDGRWYALLFQDYGAVGRIPVLIPMTWQDGWPVLGNAGKSVDRWLPLPVKNANILDGRNDCAYQGIVVSDEFNNQRQRYYPSAYWADSVGGEYGWNGSNLKVQWQWNHNPDNRYWSLTQRRGWLRLTTGQLATSIRDARNTLTQRTFGPTCSATVLMDAAHMKDGDRAGLASFQNQYGYVGVERDGGQCRIVMRRAMKKGDAQGSVIASVPLTKKKVYLRVDCDFTPAAKGHGRDIARFYYSLDNKTWQTLGDELHMAFDWPDFCGQRLAIFCYATQALGGYADFDYFHVSANNK